MKTLEKLLEEYGCYGFWVYIEDEPLFVVGRDYSETQIIFQTLSGYTIIRSIKTKAKPV